MDDAMWSNVGARMALVVGERTLPESGIRVPTLVACGREDSWSTVPHHEAMQRLAPDSTLRVVDDPMTVSIERASDLIAERRAKGPVKKTAKRVVKKTAKKATKKAAKKTTKKTTRAKAGAGTSSS